MKTETLSRQYLTLDAMRGVAAVVVVVYHGAISELHRAVFHGYLAVDFFFVLSGFVISHAYDERLRAGMRKIVFLERRMIRLYPMYLVGAGLAAAATLTGIATVPGSDLAGRQLAWAIGLSLLFLPNPYSTSIYLNGPTWSLWYELLGNLGYACFHRFMRAWVMIAVAVACLAFIAWGAARNDSINYGYRLREWHWGLARIGFGFLLGAILYRLRERFTWVPRINAAVLLGLLGLALAVPVLRGLSGPYCLIFITIVSPLLVIAGSRAEPSATLAGACSFLGRISYPLYVIHRPLQAVLLALVPASGLFQRAGLVTAFLVGVLAVSAVLERNYERPARNWLGRLSSRRLASSELAAAP